MMRSDSTDSTSFVRPKAICKMGWRKKAAFTGIGHELPTKI